MIKLITRLILVTPVLLVVACEPDKQPRSEIAPVVGRTADAERCLAEIPDGADQNQHREVWIEGATYTKGSDSRYGEEAPAHQETVEGFWIDVHEVTNFQFATFVEQTNYITVAERTPLAADYPDIPADMLKAGSALFIPPVNSDAVSPQGHWTQWWQFVPGANWRHPQGPGSDLAGLDHYPVVHVSYLDALAYAEWAGRSLPTESQWELAALGAPGAHGVGSDNGVPAANTWQGFFPVQNKATDGYAGAAPVGCYAPSDTGVYDMIGNVWELVSDVYQPGHTPGATVGSASGNGQLALRVIKGGSHLCAANYCRRDAPQSRQPQEADFGAGHIGFRTVRNTGSPKIK